MVIKGLKISKFHATFLLLFASYIQNNYLLIFALLFIKISI